MLAAFSLFLLAACSALPTPVLEQESVKGQESFKGMSALAATPERPLQVLIIHGIGTPAPYQFEGFIQSLAQRFRLVQVPRGPSEPQTSGCSHTDPVSPALIHPAPTPITIAGVPDYAQAQLYTYSFGPSSDGPVTLNVNYLLWAPLTEQIKCGLAEDDGKAPQKQALASFARDFIDSRLGDVVLYGGTFRDNVMRPSVEAALCLVTGGTPSKNGKTCQPGLYNDPTVIITHSLGGYMLMDAIDDELRNENCDNTLRNTAAGKLLANTDYIYMMANQIALLDLSRLRFYPRRLGGAAPPDPVAQRFAKCWTAVKPKSPALLQANGVEQSPTEKQIVAFSDPNDILSWRLRPRDLKVPRPERRSVKLTNVYLSNGEFSVPLLVFRPTDCAHGILRQSDRDEFAALRREQRRGRPMPAKCRPMICRVSIRPAYSQK